MTLSFFRSPLWQSAIALLFPGILFAAAVIIDPTSYRHAVWVKPALRLFPNAALLLVLLFGWRFHGSRAVLAALTVYCGWFDWPASLPVLGPLPHAEGIAPLLQLLPPINFLLLSCTRDRAVFSIKNLPYLFVGGLELTAIWLLAGPFYPQTQGLLASRVSIGAIGFTLTPMLLLYLSSMTVFLLSSLIGRQPWSISLFWSLTVLLLAGTLATGPQSYASGLAVSVLGIGMIETAYGMAYQDQLTGLPGRRALRSTMLGLGGRYAIAMLDIDFFKKFNDRYGHDVGDQVLCMVAAKIRKVGGGGKAFRYGGEEFCIIFPGLDAPSALSYLEQLRSAVENARFTLRGKNRPAKKTNRRPKNTRKTTAKKATRSVAVTISIGVADRNHKTNGKTPNQILIAADKALYRAKKRGRNQVCQ